MTSKTKSVSPSLTNDRICSKCGSGKYEYGGQCLSLTTCSVAQYESTAPTATSDRKCTALTTCTAAQFESTAATATSDRKCTALTACTSAQFESTAATATSDRKCTALTACTSAQFESTAATATADRKCSTLTTCQPGSGQTSAPTATSDRKCTACTTGQFTTQANSTCKAWTVCTATQNQSMAGTTTSDVVCVEKPGFLGGPCVTSTGSTGVETFGRGDDKKIYRRVINGNALGSWAALGTLDGTAIDSRSDLDCAGTADTIHIVAVGNNPTGALLSTTGSGTTYPAFARVLSQQVFLPSASVAVVSSAYRWLAGLTTSSLYTEGSDGTSKIPTNLQNLPFSGLDTAFSSGSSVSHYYLAVFDSTA